MTEPLKLPEFLKRPARLLRDSRVTNRALSSLVKATIPDGPIRRRLMWRVPRMGAASARLPNGRTIRMESQEFDTILNAIYYLGWTGEEPEVLPVWFRLATEAKTIVDVGAHVGHFSVVAGLTNPDACIHSFEPFPKVAKLLKRNLKINDVESSVHELALGRSTGTSSFFVVPGGVPSSSSLSGEFMSTHANVEEIKVPVATLDEVLSAVEAPLLLKIDTETTEPDVLAGAYRTLSKLKPVIIVEVLPSHDTSGAIVRELQSADYRFSSYLLTDMGPKLEDEIRAHDQWHNHLLVPHDGPTISMMGDAIKELVRG